MGKTTTKNKSDYHNKLQKCVNSVRRVASKLEVNPFALSRDTWREHRLPTDPSHTIVGQVGGWSFVQKEAARDWKNIPHNASVYGEDSANQPEDPAESVAQVDPVILHRKDLQVGLLKKEKKELLGRVSRLEDTLETLTELHKQSFEVKPVKKREKQSGKREATAVVLCSDWHIEEQVFPEQVNGRNEYNPEIATSRTQQLVQGIHWLLDLYRSKFEIRDIVLWLGGDMITGFIHEELQETNAMSPIEATMFCQRLIADELINPLLADKKLERIIVPCSYGNHGRVKKRKQFKNAAKNSYEWLVYHALAHHYRDEDRIEFQIANGSHLYLDVYDTTLRFHHGDDVRFWGGVGGLTIPLNKAIDRWNDYEDADITCIGHFHQYMSLPHAVTNGALIGYNEFALSIKAKYEPPQQAFFLIDSERGKRHSTRIWVDDESLEHSARESWENDD